MGTDCKGNQRAEAGTDNVCAMLREFYIPQYCCALCGDSAVQTTGAEAGYHMLLQEARGPACLAKSGSLARTL